MASPFSIPSSNYDWLILLLHGHGLPLVTCWLQEVMQSVQIHEKVTVRKQSQAIDADQALTKLIATYIFSLYVKLK